MKLPIFYAIYINAHRRGCKFEKLGIKDAIKPKSRCPLQFQASLCIPSKEFSQNTETPLLVFQGLCIHGHILEWINGI
jgi:hypothetical protein